MELQITGGSAGKVDVSDAVFGGEFKEGLVHQVVTAVMAGSRAGTKAQKNRAAVSGGGAKPWRQKGTGRARAGTSRSPVWVGGGRAFAASPRNFEQKINRKMYRGALRSILAELVRQERLVVVDDFQVEEAKTRLVASRLKEMGLSDVLIIDRDLDEKLFLAARNIPGIGISDVAGIDPVSLVGFEKVVMTVPAVKAVEEWLA